MSSAVNEESGEEQIEAALSQEWARIYRAAKLRRRARFPRGRTNQMLRQARVRRKWLFIGALAGTIALFVVCLTILRS